MNLFATLPNDILFNIKNIYECPIISLETKHHDSRIMLCIKYPHMLCKFNMRTSIGTQRKEDYSDETADNDKFIYGGKYNPIEYIKGQAYDATELIELNKFIDDLKCNKPTCYIGCSVYEKYRYIEINVDENITISNGDNDNIMTLGIHYKDILIQVLTKYISILHKHPSL